MYVVQDDSATRKVKGNEERGRKELVAVDGKKEVESQNGVGEGEETGNQERGWSWGGSERRGQGEQYLKKQQTEEEELGQYVKAVALLFAKCPFAHEVPPEICFVEFVGTILHEEPGKNAGTAANGSVMGFLKGK